MNIIIYKDYWFKSNSSFFGAILLFVIALSTNAEPPTKNLQEAEEIIYRKVDRADLPLYIFKPKGNTDSPRPVIIIFFGGGWVKGNPGSVVPLAREANRWGMIAVLPDYRTTERFNSTPTDSVADARAALRWVQGHAEELNADPGRIVVSGLSAGGHLALWSAIPTAPESLLKGAEGADDLMPAALALLFPVSDTTDTGYAVGYLKFGSQMDALSVPTHLPKKFPPTLIFHGTSDKIVPFENSQRLFDLLKRDGNFCQLIPWERKGHGIQDHEQWQDVFGTLKQFLVEQKVIN